MRVGLTLGKYAPLHKGHQHVIEIALGEVDHLIVLIYDAPEETTIPLPIRTQWIRTLYPHVEVLEAWDGPRTIGQSPEIIKMHDDYLKRKFADRDIDVFYSSEVYGEHVSLALGATNRLVDPQRPTVPVSATMIRANPYAHRAFMDPLVYADHVVNVVFVGAPSTGKTTLARALASRFETTWMPEYGREYWEHHQTERRLSLDQLTEIAETHLQREQDHLANAYRYLFTDTNALTTYLFALYYHNAASPRLCDLANQASSRYDLCFLCDTDIPYDDTWDRSGDVHRQWFQNQTIGALRSRKIPFFTLRGDLETRLTTVAEVLAQFSKYDNVIDIVGG